MTQAATLDYASPPQVEDPYYKWRLAFFLFFASALNYGDRTAITALYPLLKTDLNMTDVGIALIGSAFLWSYAVFSPVAGALADRMSREKLVVFSLFAWSVATAVTGLVHSPRMLWTMRGVLGLCESLYLPAAIALLAERHPTATRAKAIGMHIAGLSFGMVAGGTISGYLASHYGWRVPLLVLGGLGVIVAAAGYVIVIIQRPPSVIVNAPPPDLAASLRALGRGLTRFQVLALFFENMFMGIGVWSLINWLPLYFRETFSLSLGQAALFGSLFLQAGSTLGVIAGGFPSDLVARKHIRARMILFGVFYLVASPLMLVFLIHPGVWTIAIAVAVYGFIKGMGQINSNPLVCELLPPNARSSAIGVMNMLACIAGGIGVMVAGYLKPTLGLSNMFAMVTGVTAICGIVLLLAAKSWRIDETNGECAIETAAATE